MKCYRHPDMDAIGICSRCGRPICAFCAKMVGKELLCEPCRTAAGKARREELAEGKIEEMRPAEAKPVGEKVEKQPAAWVLPVEEKAAEKPPIAEVPPLEEKPVEDEMAEEIATVGRGVGKIRIGPPKLKFLDDALKAIFPMDEKLPVMKARGIKMITPLFFGGLTTGICLGIPFLNLFFVPILLLGSAVSIILLRAWGYFTEIVSVKIGMRIGVLSSILAVFVSTLLLVSFEVLFAESVFEALIEAFPSIAPADIDLLLKICGLDRDLLLINLRIRFLLSIIFYPLVGGIGGAFFAKYMR